MSASSLWRAAFLLADSLLRVTTACAGAGQSCYGKSPGYALNEHIVTCLVFLGSCVPVGLGLVCCGGLFSSLFGGRRRVDTKSVSDTVDTNRVFDIALTSLSVGHFH